MNIAKIMIPKVLTVFLYENQTVRQGLELMAMHGYTAVPVLDENGRYIGSVSEGDFLRCLLAADTTDKKRLEQYHIRDILRKDFCPALSVEAEEAMAVAACLNQNYVPIVDDRNTLCGILTRKGIIAYLADKERG